MDPLIKPTPAVAIAANPRTIKNPPIELPFDWMMLPLLIQHTLRLTAAPNI